MQVQYIHLTFFYQYLITVTVQHYSVEALVESIFFTSNSNPINKPLSDDKMQY